MANVGPSIHDEENMANVGPSIQDGKNMATKYSGWGKHG